MSCSILNCPNKEKGDHKPTDISFYVFPTELESFNAWIAATGKKGFLPNLSSKICSQHFDASSFHSKTGKLKKNAVPTLYLRKESNCKKTDKVEEETGIEGSESYEQTLPEISQISDVSHPRRSKRKLDPVKQATRKTMKKDLESKELQISTSDPMSCILGSDEGVDTVEVVREVTNGNVSQALQNLQSSSTPRSLVVSQTTHKIVNIVSSSNRYFQDCLPDPANTIVLNYNQNVMSKVSTASLMSPQKSIMPSLVDEQELQVLSQSISTTVALTSNEFPKEPVVYSQSSGSSESKLSACPIKLVDVKKLLQKPPVESEETVSVIQNSHTEVNKSTLPLSPVRQSNNISLLNTNNTSLNLPKIGESNGEYSSTSPLVTVSIVLDCLRVILPRSFALSRLKPSEKVAALVIKYLKLNNNKNLENLVKVNLKIIIDAAKLEDKEFGDYTTHPYHKISDIPLKLALTRVFPEKLSKSDISNEKLKCLCVVLSQDIFTDGFSILREKINKFTSMEGKPNEIITQKTNKINPPSLEKLRIGVHKIDNTPQIPKKKKRMPDDYNLQNYFEKDSNKKNMNGNISDTKKNNFFPNEGKNYENYQKDTRSEQNEIRSSKIKSYDKKAKLASNLKLIINYLEMEKCSAKDVLNNNERKINLCQYLGIKSRPSNLQKLAKLLHFVIQKKLNYYNKEMIKVYLNKIVIDKDKSNTNFTKEQNVSQAIVQNREFKQVSFVKKKIEEKLNLRPVVVLHNLVDYTKEQLLFMGEEPQREKRKANRYHNLRVPHCFTQNNSLQKYSSDHVRKMTNESYREFRRIIMKRDGEKVVFRLQYKMLSPGSSVFVKNFSSPLCGWFKGTVSKMNGPLRYTVTLDDGNTWSCVPEQMRPIPEKKEYRTQRNVKPKQLFDL